MNMQTKTLGGVGIGAAMLCAAPAAHASIVDISVPGTTVQDVFDGGGKFRVGDKLFHFDNYFSVAFDAASIGISPLDFGDAGRGFRLSDSWVDPPGDNLSSDFTLSYSVEIVDDPDTPDIDEGKNKSIVIVDNRLIFDGFAGGPGSFSRVDETLELSDGSFFGAKEVFALGNGTAQLEDFLEWDEMLGIRKLNVIKDAEFFAPTPDGFAGASFIDQTFSQVPAPAGATLAGLAGLAALRRRR